MLQLFIIECFDCLVVHDAFIQVEFGGLFVIFSLANDLLSEFAVLLWEHRVHRKCHQHVHKIGGATVELQGSAKEKELEGHWTKETEGETKDWFNGSDGFIDREDCVLWGDPMEIDVKGVEVVEGAYWDLFDTELNDFSYLIHANFLKKWRENSSCSKAQDSQGCRIQINLRSNSQGVHCNFKKKGACNC